MPEEIPTSTSIPCAFVLLLRTSNRQTGERTGQKTTDEKEALYNSIPSASLTLAWSLIISSSDRSSDTESGPPYQLQIKGFAKVRKDVVLEPGQRGSGGHCMAFVTRYLLVDRVEGSEQCFDVVINWK